MADLSRAVFADAFYYIALLNPADRFHRVAIEATDKLDRPLVTTAWVLTEIADALSAPSVRGQTHRFLRRIVEDPNTEIIGPDWDWYARGLDLYGKRSDKAWSLTDCISFEVMRDRGIADALTGDHHFQQAGFRVLLSLRDRPE